MFCLAARPDPDKPDEDPFDYFAPGQRLRLFDVVIRKLLAGSWRDAAGPKPSVDQLRAALRWLEDLAAIGDISDPVGTGLSRWPDAVTSHGDPPAGTREYVDHVAPPDPHEDVRDQTRRFVHRSLREHLTARALCRQPAGELAESLFQRLWFDPDWAEVIPTMIAGHPDADGLVDHLARLANAATPIDPIQALDYALLQAAARTEPRRGIETRRDTAIEQAIQTMLDRTEPQRWGHEFADVAHWPAIDSARNRLLRLLKDPGTDAETVDSYTWALSVLARGGPQPAELAEQVLRGIEDPNCDPMVAARLAKALAALAPEGLYTQRGAERVLGLVATPDLDVWDTIDLCEGLAALAPRASPPSVAPILSSDLSKAASMTPTR